MWVLSFAKDTCGSKNKHGRFNGNSMKDLEPRFHSKLMALSTNEKEVFALLHLGTPEGIGKYASFLGFAIIKEDGDGKYFLILADNKPSNGEFPTVLMAFHESVIESSDIPWEILRDKLEGKFDKKYV